MRESEIIIEAVRARPVDVPLARPLVTAGGSVERAPLVLVDVETSGGFTGRAYAFTYTPLAVKPAADLTANIGATLKGRALAPLAIAEEMAARFRLLGQQGLVMIAAAVLDMALWDALAKSLDLPLVRMLGGESRAVPAYNSNGLGIIGPEAAAGEALELLEPGFRAVKVRLGYDNAAADLEVMRAVREAVGSDIRLMTDYNQALSPAEAAVRMRALAGEDITWVEEPVRFDDYAGATELRAKAGLPVQLGENCWGVHDMEKALDAGACDYFMPDAVKIGGVTGWLAAAARARPSGLPLSSHLFPEVSAHLLAVTPTRHLLEFVDWAAPLLKEPLEINAADGTVSAPERAGIGIEWDEDAVARYGV